MGAPPERLALSAGVLAHSGGVLAHSGGVLALSAGVLAHSAGVLAVLLLLCCTHTGWASNITGTRAGSAFFPGVEFLGHCGWTFHGIQNSTSPLKHVIDLSKTCPDHIFGDYEGRIESSCNGSFSLKNLSTDDEGSYQRICDQNHIAYYYVSVKAPGAELKTLRADEGLAEYPTTRNNSSGSGTSLAVGLGVGISLFLVLLGFILVWCCYRNRLKLCRRFEAQNRNHNGPETELEDLRVGHQSNEDTNEETAHLPNGLV